MRPSRRRQSFTHVYAEPDPSNAVVTIRTVGPATDPDVLALQRWSIDQFVQRTLTHLQHRREVISHAP